MSADDSASLLEALERSKGELLAKPATSPTETLSEVQQWLSDQRYEMILTPACRYCTQPVNPWAHGDWDLSRRLLATPHRYYRVSTHRCDTEVPSRSSNRDYLASHR